MTITILVAMANRKKKMVTKTAAVIWRTVFGSNVTKHNHLLVSVYNIITVFKISSEKNICEFLQQHFPIDIFIRALKEMSRGISLSGGTQVILSFVANFSSFSLAESPPRDLQITAYK